MDIIRQYFPLCWLNVSVLNLPRSTRFFKHNLIFYFTIVFFIQFNMVDDIDSILEVLLETSLTLAFIALVLLLNGTIDAFIQVSSAVLFCENVVAVFLAPILFWATVAEDTPSYMTLALFLLWDLIIVGRIFKDVLRVNNAAGLVVALFYFLTSYGGAYGLYSLLVG
ncbi:hypothetical protein [Methylomonas koyamae]|uniref:Uncharacterized protein n=1 Tax=Methylomonas koyamae TaxID=702114 RepID=A0A291ILL2_9GAMM|nr:hypothetical protein [Methylomonas koyamae]ATG91163.1 hypothetical protein MKLM6_2960 [Methylomonas koyamae]OAI29325.1 hypothetical protein A1356_04285 [Methylomonas koyamae]